MHFLVTFRELRASEAGAGGSSKPGSRRGPDQAPQDVLVSGMVVASGMFSDQPGGFLLVDVNSADDLVGLLGREAMDNFYVEITRVSPRDSMTDDLERWFGLESLAVLAHGAA